MNVEPGQLVPLELSLEREDVLGFLDYPEGHQPPARIERILVEDSAEVGFGQTLFLIRPA